MRKFVRAVHDWGWLVALAAIDVYLIAVGLWWAALIASSGTILTLVAYVIAKAKLRNETVNDG